MKVGLNHDECYPLFAGLQPAPTLTSFSLDLPGKPTLRGQFRMKYMGKMLSYIQC